MSKSCITDLKFTKKVKKQRNVTKDEIVSSVSAVKFTLPVIRLMASNTMLTHAKEDRNVISNEQSIIGHNIKLTTHTFLKKTIYQLARLNPGILDLYI